VPYRYELTEAKRYLGKLLFHDPVRTARVDINTGQPKDLPAGSSFGGTFNATDPLIKQIFPKTPIAASQTQDIGDATKQTGSCGACHIGEAAGKAGQQINFNVGGEGRGYTDEFGNFVPRRRPQPILAQLRAEPIFSGDVLVDALPTLTDIWIDHGTVVVTTPAYFYHYPNPPGALNPPEASADPNLALLATGRLDQLDSVARMSPSMVGFAFNNRLLLGGFAGEPQSTPGSLNPFSDPAQENLTLLLLDAHRMLNFQAPVLRSIPAFVKLFREAFPREAAADTGDLTTLITDDTELRAQTAFLRTVVTRNTPFDRFLAGDDKALTPAELRGARLFFTPAVAGGAGCVSCHSGPMLNKQTNDADVTGVGAFVNENFINVGIGDHPVQALNALARGHLNAARLGKDGYPYHAEDTGRQEITHDPKDAFKFRVLTMRQLKDGRNFTHNGSFTKVRDVVEYFNAGVPQDPTAAAAHTLSTRFTNPRGPGYPRGLGLAEAQVDDLSAFLENALYDPGLVKYDPRSSTDTLQPNERDLHYSKYHPELVALGAKDGMMLSLDVTRASILPST
jgi:cytochrome c peroxidase